jgi:hypothetical protein
MTLTQSTRIAAELKDLARDFEAAEQIVLSIPEADAVMRNAQQVRFVATMVSTAADGHYDALGFAWMSAGRRFLDALLERARMDEVHASRASRRLEGGE